MENERGGDGEYLESEDTKSFYVASKSAGSKTQREKKATIKQANKFA